jgi:putative heme iron utilization protein
LIFGDRTARLMFKERVTSSGALRQALVALAKEAREGL